MQLHIQAHAKQILAAVPEAVPQGVADSTRLCRVKQREIRDCVVLPTLTAVKPVTRASAMARAFSGSPSSCSSFLAAGLKHRTAASSISLSVSSARSPTQHTPKVAD